MYRSFEIISNQSSQFFSILGNSRYSNSSTPVKVIVALEVGKLGDSLVFEVGGVVADGILGRCGRALCDFLWYKVEFEILSYDIIVDQ